MKGTFIVLEGGEGAGKGAIRKFLESRFTEAVFTREPGGTPLAEKIRSVMLSPEAKGASAETQFNLIFASRFEHAQKKILPALEAGKLVISERFDPSTYAYQIFGQQAQHLKPAFFEYRKILQSWNCLPDLYIFLDVAPKIGLGRASKKKELADHFEMRPIDFHERVREGYKEFLKNVPHVIVDASLPLEEVQKEVLEIVKRFL